MVRAEETLEGVVMKLGSGELIMRGTRHASLEKSSNVDNDLSMKSGRDDRLRKGPMTWSRTLKMTDSEAVVVTSFLQSSSVR